VKLVEQFDVRRFPLRFGGGNINVNAYMIISYGPLSYESPLGGGYLTSAKRYKSILILYNESDSENDAKSLAEKLKKHLDEGLDNKRIFPGFNPIFRLGVEVSLVPFRGSYEPQQAQEIYDTFEEHCGNIDTCFPLVILPQVSRSIYNSIYYVTKAVFLKREVPSQVFTIDVLKDEKRHRWSLLPVAIQIFAKMGGVPYIIDRGVLGEEVAEDAAVFIMGLGISHHPLQEKRGVGFITVFDHHGTWCFVDSTALILGRRESISEKLGALLKRGIRQVLELSKAKENILVIHYSGKEVGRTEEEAISDAIRSTGADLSKFATVHILKIKDSDFVIGDLESPYLVDNTRTYYPPVGVTFQLKPDLYLMVTSGYFIASGDVVRGNIRVGLPRVKIVSRHREMETFGYGSRLSDKQLLATIFGMCRLNYSSVQNPVLREPATIKYSREIAWLSLRLQDLGTDLDQASRIKRIMWFI